MAHRTDGRVDLSDVPTSSSSVPPERPPDPSAKRRYATPPKNVYVNSQNDFTDDGRSPRARWPRRQINRLGRWVKKLFKRKAKLFHAGVVIHGSNPLDPSSPDPNPPDSGSEEKGISKPNESDAESTRSTESGEFIRTMRLELTNRYNNPVAKRVQVLFDTGNPKNILSSKLVGTYDLSLEGLEERVALKTIGNNEWRSSGTIKGRFILKGSDPSWIDADFELSKNEEKFDVILGSKSITKYNMMKVNDDIPIAYTGFRAKRKSCTKAEIEQYEKDQKKRREENEANKAKARQNASEASTSASLASDPSSSGQ